MVPSLLFSEQSQLVAWEVDGLSGMCWAERALGWQAVCILALSKKKMWSSLGQSQSKMSIAGFVCPKISALVKYPSWLSQFEHDMSSFTSKIRCQLLLYEIIWSLPILWLKPAIIQGNKVSHHLQETLTLCIRFGCFALMDPPQKAPIISIKCWFIMNPDYNPLTVGLGLWSRLIWVFCPFIYCFQCPIVCPTVHMGY